MTKVFVIVSEEEFGSKSVYDVVSSLEIAKQLYPNIEEDGYPYSVLEKDLIDVIPTKGIYGWLILDEHGNDIAPHERDGNIKRADQTCPWQKGGYAHPITDKTDTSKNENSMWEFTFHYIEADSYEEALEKARVLLKRIQANPLWEVAKQRLAYYGFYLYEDESTWYTGERAWDQRTSVR